MDYQPGQHQPNPAQRLGEMLGAARRRGHEELTRPGGLGDTAHGAFRRWCQRVWRSRGGGLYAVGFMVAFGYLETVDVLFDDVPQLFAINWFSGEVFGFAVDFLVDTLRNMLLAFLWPVLVAQWQAPLGLLLLAAMFLLFPRVAQAPLESWLFEGQPAPDLRAEREARRREKRARREAQRAAGTSSL